MRKILETLLHSYSSPPNEDEIENVGVQMHQLMAELFPICRSITGQGTRETLQRLKKHIPLVINKIPSGTKAYDWEIPKEWNIRDAYIKNAKGEKIVDFNISNLHVVNYSDPVHQIVSLQELKDHLYTLPEHPDWIPYKTSYYKRQWGFCISHNQYEALEDGMYEVYIDATLEPGALAYGELVIKGEISDEVLISTHICHPSLCNDNLSGISLVTFLAKHLMFKNTRYTYRFLFIPGTIGAITWLSINELKARRIKHGLVATLLGDTGPFTYKRSRRGNAEIDEVVQYVLEQEWQGNASIRDFVPHGYDERQFCSPGFDLPVGCLTRTPYGEFPEYHTSADNLEFVTADAMEASFELYKQVIDVLEYNERFCNTQPRCEPQLGRRGLYNKIGGKNDKELQQALLWVLNLSDGEHSLLDIARRSSMKFTTMVNAARLLKKAKLLREIV